MINGKSTARFTYDTSADDPHQQNERPRRCREAGCHTLTFRAHAVCAEHVDILARFGCCTRCEPTYFAEMTA